MEAELLSLTWNIADANAKSTTKTIIHSMVSIH